VNQVTMDNHFILVVVIASGR